MIAYFTLNHWYWCHENSQNVSRAQSINMNTEEWKQLVAIWQRTWEGALISLIEKVAVIYLRQKVALTQIDRYDREDVFALFEREGSFAQFERRFFWSIWERRLLWSIWERRLQWHSCGRKHHVGSEGWIWGPSSCWKTQKCRHSPLVCQICL